MNLSSSKLNMTSVCMTRFKYSRPWKLTITEHVQPLCTRKLVYYIHATWVGYVANLKMPTKSWMAAALEVAGFYSAPRSRRRKVTQSTKARESQSLQMLTENIAMNISQRNLDTNNTKLQERDARESWHVWMVPKLQLQSELKLKAIFLYHNISLKAQSKLAAQINITNSEKKQKRSITLQSMKVR
jgi:hypothetical protein